MHTVLTKMNKKAYFLGRFFLPPAQIIARYCKVGIISTADLRRVNKEKHGKRSQKSTAKREEAQVGIMFVSGRSNKHTEYD
jgi:hypothetical protein